MNLELELLTPENCVKPPKPPKEEVARVSISTTGRISINNAATTKIKWMLGSKVAIGRDPKDGDFYLINVGPAGSGFQVDEVFAGPKRSPAGIAIKNTELAKKIREGVDKKADKTMRFVLGAEVKAGKNTAFCLLYKPEV